MLRSLIACIANIESDHGTENCRIFRIENRLESNNAVDFLLLLPHSLILAHWQWYWKSAPGILSGSGIYIAVKVYGHWSVSRYVVSVKVCGHRQGIQMWHNREWWLGLNEHSTRDLVPKNEHIANCVHTRPGHKVYLAWLHNIFSIKICCRRKLNDEWLLVRLHQQNEYSFTDLVPKKCI